MKTNNPLLSSDGYKTGHHLMYAPGTTTVYSNYTCRNVNYMPTGAKDVVVFGIEYTFKYIQDFWNDNFFSKPKDEVCNHAKKVLSAYLGIDYNVSHFEALHDLGYLPIEVRGLSEGLIVKAGIPLFTIKNTLPQFFWVTNFLETLISTLIWKPVHSASLAYAYKKVLTKYALETDQENLWFVDFQGHDFSFRGMQAPDAAISSAMGFLTSFKGSDTIPAIPAVEYYYNTEATAFSVQATEHSVMCSGSKEDEIGTFRRLMETFPTGILSVVSDTWDLWKVLTEYLPQLKEEIMSRDGKLVIRPDSGDPVDIICGLEEIKISRWTDGRPAKLREWGFTAKGSSTFENTRDVFEPEIKGLIELLWDTFGGTINEQGYKVLDSHIGAIYGDSITLERAEQICERLKAKGFASTNIVLGVGSYSMGYATRDQQGGAVKSTAVEINGELIEIFKDPVTDDGTKKSAKGLLGVYYDDFNELTLYDQLDWNVANSGELKLLFKNGKFVRTTSFEEIRNRINSTL
jgi:nicotinamide phosphoribosyltransferase